MGVLNKIWSIGVLTIVKYGGSCMKKIQIICILESSAKFLVIIFGNYVFIRIQLLSIWNKYLRIMTMELFSIARTSYNTLEISLVRLL